MHPKCKNTDAQDSINSSVVETFHETDILRKFRNVRQVPDFPRAEVFGVADEDGSQEVAVSSNVKKTAPQKKLVKAGRPHKPTATLC